MAACFPSDDQHRHDQHHRPEAKNDLDLTQKMPYARMGGMGVSETLEELGRESMNQRNAEQDCANNLNRGGAHLLCVG